MNRNMMLRTITASLIAIGGFAATSYAQGEIDTLLSAESRTRFRLDNILGDVQVSTWDRNAVRVQATRRGDVDIHSGGSVIRVDGGPGHGRRGGNVDFTITVPARMDVSIETVNGDISIRGAGGRVEAGSVKGSVDVSGGRTVVDLSSVGGAVTLTGARGNISVESVNASVSLTDVTGNIEAETVNGPILLRAIDTRRLDASSVNGRIEYDGAMHDDGWYSFETHNGRIILRLPPEPDASVTISTYNGDVLSDYPIGVRRTEHDEAMTFVLGSGGAQVTLETFNGSVELRRRP